MQSAMRMALAAGLTLSLLSLLTSLSTFSSTTEPHSNGPFQHTTMNSSMQSTFKDILVVGNEYQNETCSLKPAWGQVHFKEGECIGTELENYNTTATHLSCSNDKPILQDRTHPGLTIALLYFAKPAMLFHQLDVLASYPDHVRRNLTLLVIDDGSPPRLRASDFDLRRFSSQFRIRLATITTARDWNIGGARNLAFYLADTPHVLLLDLDMEVPFETMDQILTWELRTETNIIAHRFNRKRPDGRSQKHPAVALMDTSAYWESGGCDEDFCGTYGYTDVHFWHRWKKDPARIQNDHMDAFIVEYEMPACHSAYIPEGPERDECKKARKAMQKPSKDKNRNLKRFKYKTKNGCWSNRYLRFRWRLDF